MLFGVTVILYFVNIFNAITETKKKKKFLRQVSKFQSKDLYEHGCAEFLRKYFQLRM